jgi:hypothetical protein
MPHPEVWPAEPEDWRPILDREVARLPRKYREAIVLYHLEGWPHREAASKLGVPEGTLSTRLIKARRLLASRLARYGLSLAGAALATALGEGSVRAAVPAPLVAETVRAATLVAAGQLAAVTTPAALLTKGVLKTMLMMKLKLALGMVMVVAVLGATGVAYRAGAQAPPTDTPRVEKPRSELEALRKENELLKLNLQVVLEKVRAQEAELRAFRGVGASEKKCDLDLLQRVKGIEAAKKKMQADVLDAAKRGQKIKELYLLRAKLLGEKADARKKDLAADAVILVEEALKVLQTARDAEGRQRAAKALDQALRKLKEQMEDPERQPKKP